MAPIEIRTATERDVPIVLEMIRGLAEYEKLAHMVTATEERLRQTLFGAKPAAEVMLAYSGGECAGFALFFTNYSTFLARPGIFLEDLFVKPHLRGKGIGLELLRRLAAVAAERGCGRMEWEVLNWNEPSIQFYKKLGAIPMDEWTKYRLSAEAIEKLALGSDGASTSREATRSAGQRPAQSAAGSTAECTAPCIGAKAAAAGSPALPRIATWNAPVCSEATFRTSGRASCGKARSKAWSISSSDMPFARHSKIRETLNRVPQTANLPPELIEPPVP